MDELEILYLKTTVSFGLKNQGSKCWSKAFDYYNSYHEKQLTTNCLPCYTKVLQFILNSSK